MSQAFSTIGQTITVEVTVSGEDFPHDDHRWATVLQVWDAEELVELLRDRLHRSEAEVRELLVSYDAVKKDFPIAANED